MSLKGIYDKIKFLRFISKFTGMKKNKIFSKKFFLRTTISAIFLFASVFSGALSASATSVPQTHTIGTLIKGSGPEVYLVTGEKMVRWIVDEKTFLAMNFSWSDIISVELDELIQYSIGEPLQNIAKPSLVPTVAESEAFVRKEFAQNPEMIEVAKCESGFRQFNNNGTPLKGSGLYIGVFQIDEKIHADYAKNLGMDIYTLEGNVAYAKYLFEKSGTRPWSGCVRPTVDSVALTDDLKLGDESQQVKVLQQLLNKAGYFVATTGPGSLGNETIYFGNMTLKALQKFQCEKNIVCSGSPETTGYGLVGPKTRSALL